MHLNATSSAAVFDRQHNMRRTIIELPLKKIVLTTLSFTGRPTAVFNFCNTDLQQRIVDHSRCDIITRTHKFVFSNTRSDEVIPGQITQVRPSDSCDLPSNN